MVIILGITPLSNVRILVYDQMNQATNTDTYSNEEANASPSSGSSSDAGNDSLNNNSEYGTTSDETTTTDYSRYIYNIVINGRDSNQ